MQYIQLKDKLAIFFEILYYEICIKIEFLSTCWYVSTNSIWHWSNTTIQMKETPLVPFESMACFLYLLRPFEQILGGVSLQNHSINTSSTFELVNEVPQEQLSCCEILFVRKCQIMCRPVLSPFLPRCLCCHVLWTLAHMEVSHLMAYPPPIANDPHPPNWC